MKFKLSNVFLIAVLFVCGSQIQAADSAALLSALREILPDTSIDPASKKALFEIVAPQVAQADLGKIKLSIKNAIYGGNQKLMDEALAMLIPQTTAAFSKKFSDTIIQNAVPIANNFKADKEAPGLGKPDPKEVLAMQQAVAKLSAAIGAPAA